MTIIIKNKDTLIYKEFKFKCCVGKKGFSKFKIEGDKKTPTGTFALGNLYYRSDKKERPATKLKLIKIKKNIGWCNDVKSKKNYNKIVKTNSKFKHERLFRNDYKYNFFLLVKYNYNKVIIGRGSAIFIHLTKKYNPTLGCIGLREKDFLILIKLINKNTKIKIL